MNNINRSDTKGFAFVSVCLRVSWIILHPDSLYHFSLLPLPLNTFRFSFFHLLSAYFFTFPVPFYPCVSYSSSYSIGFPPPPSLCLPLPAPPIGEGRQLKVELNLTPLISSSSPMGPAWLSLLTFELNLGGQRSF